MTFGRYPDIRLKPARILVKEFRALLAIGIDPYQQRQDAIAKQINKEQEDISVAELMSKYIELYAKPNTRRWKATEANFNNHILPVFRNKKAKDVTRRDVVNLLDKIKSSDKPTAANHVLSAMKGMYSWAVERDEVQFNPCAGIKKPVPVAERERVLSKHEINGFWDACNQLRYPFGPLCQLLLLTGQAYSTLNGELEDEEKIAQTKTMIELVKNQHSVSEKSAQEMFQSDKHYACHEWKNNVRDIKKLLRTKQWPKVRGYFSAVNIRPHTLKNNNGFKH